jgi:hypothetical protein
MYVRIILILVAITTALILGSVLPVVAKCPDARIVLSETAAFCTVCREHSMDGWAVNLRIENHSELPIVTLGFLVPDVDGNISRDSRGFLLTWFVQWRLSGEQKWRSESNHELPSFVRKRYYLRDDKLLISPGDSFESRLVLGWNFDYPQSQRVNVFAGFEGPENPCIVRSHPFTLVEIEDSASAKLVLLDEF